MQRIWHFFLLLMITACGPYPRDIEGTTDRIRATKVIRVGIVADARNRSNALAINPYLSQIERVTGARRTISQAAAEPLFARLERGDLDLVIGEFADDTPWLPEVAFVDPLAERSIGKRIINLVPVARNGENRWIMLLEKAARESRIA